MMHWPLYPVWMIDLIGSLCMIIASSMCLGIARKIFRRDPENALANYLLWLCIAIFAFSVSRSLGHIIKHILYFSGYNAWWKTLSPISGSINTVTFVVIASITLYFRRTETIMNRMLRDHDKISSFSRELLELNRDIEKIVSERTQTQMALYVAHEVRNPAMIIGGMARRMKKITPDSSPEKERLDVILHEAKKLESLVAELGKPHDQTEKKFFFLDLNTIVEEAVEIIQEEADKKEVILFLDRTPERLPFQCSKHLIKIAIMHVLRNALTACNSGDTIRIVTEAGEKSVQICIEDTGSGIPQEVMDHIFEPFYRSQKGPTGIGLPYVKQIVEEHKGTITISSKENRGTFVLISLPPLLGELSRETADH